MTSSTPNSKTKSVAVSPAANAQILLSQAIKVALKEAAKFEHAESSHAQMLDAIAQKLGFTNFRALKAVEMQTTPQVSVSLHPLQTAFANFQKSHPGQVLELSVPFRPTEDEELPPFKFVLTPQQIESIVELERSSKKLNKSMKVSIGGLPVGRGGTNVSLAVFSSAENTWIAFSALTYHKHFEEEVSGLGDLEMSSLVQMIEGLSCLKLADIQKNNYAILDESCVAIRIDESTIRFTCEFPESEDYMDYPSEEDSILLPGSKVEDGQYLEGFVAAVVEDEVLLAPHYANYDDKLIKF